MFCEGGGGEGGWRKIGLKERTPLISTSLNHIFLDCSKRVQVAYIATSASLAVGRGRGEVMLWFYFEHKQYYSYIIDIHACQLQGLLG